MFFSVLENLCEYAYVSWFNELTKESSIPWPCGQHRVIFSISDKGWVSTGPDWQRQRKPCNLLWTAAGHLFFEICLNVIYQVKNHSSKFCTSTQMIWTEFQQTLLCTFKQLVAVFFLTPSPCLQPAKRSHSHLSSMERKSWSSFRDFILKILRFVRAITWVKLINCSLSIIWYNSWNGFLNYNQEPLWVTQLYISLSSCFQIFLNIELNIKNFSLTAKRCFFT